MIKMERTEYCRVTREYTYIIDDMELEEITTYIKEQVGNPDKVPEITYNHIKLALEGKIGTTADKNEFGINDVMLTVKSRYGLPYKTSLIEIIKNTLNSWIWEAPSEELDCDTDDYVDEFYETTVQEEE